VVCNTGHYDVEVNSKELKKLAEQVRTIRQNNEEYTLRDGKKIYLLAEGRLVNLAAAEGHPSEVMDMSFANQFLSMVYLAEHGKGLENKVYDITAEQDQDVAGLKLETMGITIDKLTGAQEKYLKDYSAGT